MSEASYVLDGLHHHARQTDLRIVEHYTDTAGATDHVFGLCHLLGYGTSLVMYRDSSLLGISQFSRGAPWTKQLLELSWRRCFRLMRHLVSLIR